MYRRGNKFMQKRKFTVVAQLQGLYNQDLLRYVNLSLSTYAKAVRETFYIIRGSSNFNRSKHNTYLQNRYDIVKRTANSIISDALGRFNALKELKLYEKRQLEHKIEFLETNIIPKLVTEKNVNFTKLQEGLSISLTKQRNLRKKIVAKKSKLNRLKQKLANLEYQLTSGKLKLCFGTKRLLKLSYEKFIEQRDSQINFVGSRTETSGNQLLTLVYNRRSNQFSIRLRKDFGGYKDAKGDDKYVYGKVHFKHHKGSIVSILRQGNSPLSYKIIRRGKRYYLYCTFEIQMFDSDFTTSKTEGVFGLDFNKGFITLSETNKYGHLIGTKFLPYRFKSGNKTNSDLQSIASYVTNLSVKTGKGICIESLDFSNKKSKTESKQGIKYNEMIHSLAYTQFTDSIESTSYRKGVFLIKVNPAWTSWLAKKLYCPLMKLNTHIGASYVIARRGQGYRDAVSF